MAMIYGLINKDFKDGVYGNTSFKKAGSFIFQLTTGMPGAPNSFIRI
jgi:hypothetical protein